MRTNTILIAAFSMAMLGGCATTGTDGVVQISQGTYMIGGLGGMMDFSASAVKMRFYQDAAKYCAESNRAMVPISSTGKDSGIATYASAEVQFKCVPQSDAITQK